MKSTSGQCFQFGFRHKNEREDTFLSIMLLCRGITLNQIKWVLKECSTTCFGVCLCLRGQEEMWVVWVSRLWSSFCFLGILLWSFFPSFAEVCLMQDTVNAGIRPDDAHGLPWELLLASSLERSWFWKCKMHFSLEAALPGISLPSIYLPNLLSNWEFQGIAGTSGSTGWRKKLLLRCLRCH